MIEHLGFQKNRIRFPAKIKSGERELDKEHHSRDGSVRKVIRLGNSESLGSLDQPLKDPRHPDPKVVPHLNTSLNVVTTPLTTRNWKTNQQHEWRRSSFNKPNYLYDSWIKTQNSEAVSRISREDYTKQSDFGDFNDFDRNTSFNNLKRHDTSFQYPLKISSCHHNLLTSRNLNDFTRETSYLERTIEEKNLEINNLVFSIGEERRILETKIMDLEFQIINQKLSSERALDSVTFSLKNMERICRDQENEIGGLKQQLWRSREERRGIEEEWMRRVRDEGAVKEELERMNQVLVEQIEFVRGEIESSYQQNQQLREIVREMEYERGVIEERLEEWRGRVEEADWRIGEMERETVGKGVTEDGLIQVDHLLSQGVLTLEVEQPHMFSLQYQNPEEMIMNEMSDCKGQDQELDQSGQQHLGANEEMRPQQLIKQYQEELEQGKKRLEESNQTMESLENKVRELSQEVGVLGLGNELLGECNEEIMVLRLQSLNLRFQLLEGEEGFQESMSQSSFSHP